MAAINEILKNAIDNGASDIHFTVGIPPVARIDGALVTLGGDALKPDDTRAFAGALLDEKYKQTLEKKGEVDLAYSVANLGRFRVNVYMQRGSVAIAVRVLNLEIPAPEKLGIPESVVEVIKKQRGLVLVTGPTGSGKSTTLASLINVLNENYPYHIITLEDPIEYLHRHKKGMVNQREMGADTENYASGLRAALREDPDVILVGEMRDLETISIAVTAAETGHLVFSTLHTIGAAATIDRIIDVFPPYQQQQIRTQLAEVLVSVISQQLIAKKSGKGRCAAFEVMHINPAIRNLIRESKTYQIPSVMQTSKKAGMQTMDDCIFELYSKNIISSAEAMRHAQDVAYISKRLV
ncbi:MAG: type IV pilus twitching motility protein PilT [Clostridiales bacterium]|jgi:twitching motility protein PilT|nr:type IV pilus twitching motility protein PilT [Clostridiales bacterium]